MTTQVTAYSEIERLVKSFKDMPPPQRKGLNEMQTRLGYILPLFKALGWDTSNINFVPGLMNSSLLNFVFKTSFGSGLHVYPENIRQLPIRRIDFANAAEQSAHDEIVKLVEKACVLYRPRIVSCTTNRMKEKSNGTQANCHETR